MDDILETRSIYLIEYQLIENVKQLRLNRGWSQETLSLKMGFVETFVGKCESLKQPEKYNLRHIGILKKVFGFKSLDDLFPKGIPKDELVKIRYKKVPRIKSDGTPSKFTDNQVIDIVVVEEKTKSKSNSRK